MAEYTPTTDEVRDHYSDPGHHPGDWSKYQARREAQFDRWLAELGRQVREAAWDEGYGDDLDAKTPRTNPYRERS